MLDAPVKPLKVRFTRHVRVPLQTGASSIAPTLISIPCALALFVGVGMCVVTFDGGANIGGGGGGGGSRLALFVAGVMLLGGTGFVVCVRQAFKRRASDIVFSEDGVAIEGGAFHGRAWRWSQMDPWQSEITTDENEYVEIMGKRTYAQKLSIENLVVAVSTNEDEQRSFAVVLGGVLTGAVKDSGAPEPRQVTSDVLACDACGAAIVPADAESVACRYCGARVEVGAEVRERVRAARRLAMERVRLDGLVAKLLRQPGARRTNMLLLLAALALYLAVLPTLAFVDSAHESRWLVAIAFVLFVLTFPRVDIASRKAVRALITGFAAREPVRQGDPSACRRCGAPLVDITEGDVVVRCVYCQAANVLGIDLGADVASALSDDRELEAAVAVRKNERVKQVGTIVLCGALVVAFILLEMRSS